MAIQAQWRTAKNDPRTILGWTLLAIVEESPRALLQTVVVVLTLAATIAICASIGVAPEGLPFGTDHWPFKSRRRRARSSLAELAPKPTATPWYPVRIFVRHDGLTIGADEAIVSFTDRWLVAEGRRTSFTAMPHQLGSFGDGRLKVYYGTHLELDLLPFDQIDSRIGLVSEIEIAIRRFRKGPTPLGQACHPPQQPHPWAKGRGWAAALLGLALLGASIALLPFGFALHLVAIIAALCGFWWLGIAMLRLRNLSLLHKIQPYKIAI